MADRQIVDVAKLVEEYVAWKGRTFDDLMDRDARFELGTTKAERSLSPVGSSKLQDAMRAYLVGRTADGDQLVESARHFLQVAHETRERQQHGYITDLSEAIRDSALAYATFLASGEIHQEALEEARRHFGLFFASDELGSQRSFAYWIPSLLYTRSYDVISPYVRRYPITLDCRSPAKSRGALVPALCFSEAENDQQRETSREILKGRLSDLFFDWIDRGSYTQVAYALCALFPAPFEPGRRQQISDVWQYIPPKKLLQQLLEWKKNRDWRASL
jgi:hypothetical protein